MRLLIAAIGAPAAALLLAPAPAAAQSPCGATYTVQPGDTLYSIAQRCRTSVSAIVRANAQVTHPSRIEAGWRLAIPGGRDDPPRDDPGGDRTHRVQPGDTLYSLANRFGVTLSALLAANAGIDPRRIEIGDVIRIPGGGAAPPDRPAPPSGDMQASVSPGAAPPGAEVTIRGRNFRPRERVRVAVGPPRSEYSTISTTQANSAGEIHTRVRVPEWADPRDELVWVLIGEDRREAFARGFQVVSGDQDDRDPDDDRVEVTGVITREGVECPALRTDDGELYTLAGDLGRFGPGDRVTVRGSRAEMSICQQGRTISVEGMRAARWRD